jgi:hypothetical protein
MLRGVKEERNILQALKRMNAKWVQNILRRNCLKKTRYWGKEKRRIRRERNVSSYWMTERFVKLMETEKEALPGRSHCMENSRWKRLGTHRTREHRVNDIHLEL